jgi:hypothetical protein
VAPVAQNMSSSGVTIRAPLAQVVGTMAHMAVNRLLRESGGLDELRVHDALGRLYAGRLARARPEARQ